ncbi:olfactory receptor 10A2-like [Gopherus evgoodei]|uniref:olfactory receptor 10A2-like n=1 Tax=Gopherus evgoodei TaxID=1825980 RepID=UPI0011CF816A|nr:olfactory receptor 10A2-like [Gopherus evgoodei]
MEDPGIENETIVGTLILLGFDDLHDLQIFLFPLFFMVYLATTTGNILIIITVSADRSLHTPMYFFLGNLSFLEILYTSNIAPRMLVDLLRQDKCISFTSCITQLYVFCALGTVECFLLMLMSYDRYLAICQPLHYADSMNWNLCIKLAAGIWVWGFLLAAVLQLLLEKSLTLCGPNEIDHFFCDLTPLLKLSCSDTYMVKVAIFVSCCIVPLIPFLLTITSYIHILLAVLKIPSKRGKQRTFSTCSSHLIVVTTFYGTLTVTYIVSTGSQSIHLNKILSLLYVFVTPLFNPIVYSLRNKEVKEALRKLISKIIPFPDWSNIPHQFFFTRKA